MNLAKDEIAATVSHILDDNRCDNDLKSEGTTRKNTKIQGWLRVLDAKVKDAEDGPEEGDE